MSQSPDMTPLDALAAELREFSDELERERIETEKLLEEIARLAAKDKPRPQQPSAPGHV